MVAGRSQESIAELSQTLASSELTVAERFISNGHSNPLYGVKEWPDILVFHLSSMGSEEIESLLENPQAARPHTIIIGPADNVDCMRMSMQVGVRDYIEEPCELEQLQGSIERIRDELQTDVAPAKVVAGDITALVSAKGGAGASFLSANLAHMAAAGGESRVALLDLDLQFGSLAQYLDLKPEHGLMSVVELVDQLDSVAIDAYMTKHASGLRLLSAVEDEIVLQRDIEHSQFTVLLELLKHSYDRTFIDLPRQIDEASADVYEAADNIIVITQQEVASVRDASRLYRLIRSELSIPEERFRLVINRFDKNSAIEISDICRSVGIPTEQVITVPNSYHSVAESINVGVPIFDHNKSSRVTRALIELNAQLVGVELQDNPNVVRRVFKQLVGVNLQDNPNVVRRVFANLLGD
jgi:pilus assembly protein CpaE